MQKEIEPSLDGGPRWFYYALALDRLGERERALAIFDQLDAAIANDPTLNSSVAVRNEVAEALGVDTSLQNEGSDQSNDDEAGQPSTEPPPDGKSEAIELTP